MLKITSRLDEKSFKILALYSYKSSRLWEKVTRRSIKMHGEKRFVVLPNLWGQSQAAEFSATLDRWPIYFYSWHLLPSIISSTSSILSYLLLRLFFLLQLFFFSFTASIPSPTNPWPKVWGKKPEVESWIKFPVCFSLNSNNMSKFSTLVQNSWHQICKTFALFLIYLRLAWWKAPLTCCGIFT